MLAVDVSGWLRPGAGTSPGRLFCHVYGRGKGQAQMIPGWPYSVIAALESGRTSWTAVLDAIRLGPEDDEAEVTARHQHLLASCPSRPSFVIFVLWREQMITRRPHLLTATRRDHPTEGARNARS